MVDAHDELDFLTRSANRVTVLGLLATRSCAERELVETTDISKTTVGSAREVGRGGRSKRLSHQMVPFPWSQVTTRRSMPTTSPNRSNWVIETTRTLAYISGVASELLYWRIR